MPTSPLLGPNQQAFVDYYGPLAQDISEQTGLHPVLVLGQMANESGWGQSIPGNNNPFGISPVGPDGKQYVAKYPTVQDGAQAYVDLINRKYPQIAKSGDDYYAQAAALGKTDYNPAGPEYGKRIAAQSQLVETGFAPPTKPGTDLSDEGLMAKMHQYTPKADDPAQWKPEDDNAILKKMEVMAPSQPQPTSKPAPGDFKQGYSDAGSSKAADMGVPGPGGAPTPTGNPLIDRDAYSRMHPTDPQALIQAAKQGYNDAPTILTPEWQAALDAHAPLAGYVVHGVNALLGVGGGAYRGLQEGVAQTGDNVSPGLGRDIAGFMDAAPALFGAAGGRGVGAGVSLVRADNRLANAAPLSPAFRDSVAKFTPRPEAPFGDYEPNPNVTNAPMGVVPKLAAVGADATSEPIPEYTPAERYTLEKRHLNQQPTDRLQNGIDPTDYGTGATPLHAAVEPSVQNALDEKRMVGADPAFREKIEATNRENNAARLDYYDSIAGDPNAIAKAVEERKAAFQSDMNSAMGNAKSVDVQPVLDFIDDELSGASGKRDAVRTALEQARAQLLDKDGVPETSARLLDGARNNITDMLSRTGQQASPNMRHATGVLTQAKDLLVDQIDGAAPGFKAALQNFADASRPIDAMKLLQDKRAGLVDVGGNIRPGSMQKLMADVVKARDPNNPGVNPAKSLTDEQMQQLFNLRNDVSRDWYKNEIARVKGSDSFQLLNADLQRGTGIASTLGNALFQAAGHIGANYLSPTNPMGNLGFHVFQEGVRRKMEARQLQKAIDAREALSQELSHKLTNPHPEFGTSQ